MTSELKELSEVNTETRRVIEMMKANPNVFQDALRAAVPYVHEGMGIGLAQQMCLANRAARYFSALSQKTLDAVNWREVNLHAWEALR